MDIAIVGAAGWIGNAVLQEALIRGHKVTALVRDPRKITTADVNSLILMIRHTHWLMP